MPITKTERWFNWKRRLLISGRLIASSPTTPKQRCPISRDLAVLTYVEYALPRRRCAYHARPASKRMVQASGNASNSQGEYSSVAKII